MKEGECDSFACARRPVRQTGFLLYKYGKQVFYCTNTANRFSTVQYHLHLSPGAKLAHRASLCNITAGIFALLFGQYSLQLDNNQRYCTVENLFAVQVGARTQNCLDNN